MVNTKTARHAIAAMAVCAIVISGCLTSPELSKKNEPQILFADTQAPAATITQPDNSTEVMGTVQIVADATDNIGIDHVEFYIDYELLDDGYDDTAPYVYEWSTSNLQDSSEHTLFVIAYDTSLNQSCSDTIAVRVLDCAEPPEDEELPFVCMIVPEDGDTIAGIITMLAYGSDNAGVAQVEFYIDGAIPADGMEFNAPYEHVWDTRALANGSGHEIAARIVDSSDNAAWSDTINVTVDNSIPQPPDTQAPAVAVATPSDGDIISGNVYIRADAVDNVAVHHVDFFIDGAKPSGSTKFAPPYEYLWNASTLYNGTVHSIVARGTDTSDNTSYSDTVYVTVQNLVPPPPDREPPFASIVSPVEGAELSGIVLIRAGATDNAGIKQVEFCLDEEMLPGGIDRTAPYEYAWDTSSLPDGTAHILTARAVDTSDNAAVSNAVHVTIDNLSNSPPSVVLLQNLSDRQIFPTDNWWNLDVSGAPVDNNSQNFINWIGAGRTLHGDFGGPPYGIPYVCVGGDQPLRPVYFYAYGDESDDGAPGQPAGYPIPNEAYLNPNYIEGGVAGGGGSGDRHLLVIDRDKWLLFELFGTHWNSSLQRWEAASGAVFNLSTNDRRPEGWTSTDAAGLAVFPGLIRYDEVYGSIEIEHALRFTSRASDGYVWPASHAAGTTTGALPMGARLRLKASVNISGYSPAVQKIFRAMKKYGLILADNGSDMYIQGTMDARWDMGLINGAFHGMPASNFEVIQLGWDPVND